ncbi:hypothetical protein ALC57_18815, partial [Trachymyrmex cornetzi]
VFGEEVIFHIVPSDFPISQSGILGNDFFEQSSSKIDYAKGYLNISEIKVPFLSPEIIIASPRSESLFYIRVKNPEVNIGYIPRMKIAHGIYLGDIVENVSGKAYLNVISTLDEEVEVQVPTLRLKPLDELFDNNELDYIEARDDRTEIENTQVHFTNPNNQERNEVPHCDTDLEKDEDKNVNNNNNEKIEIEENKMLNKTKKDINNTTQNRGKNKVKRKFQEIMRENKRLNKNSYLKEDFQTFTETLDSKIHGGGSYQTPHENLYDPRILEESSHTSLVNSTPEDLYDPRILEESFRTSLVNSTPCEEGSNQTSLRHATHVYLEESKEKDLLILPEKIKSSKDGTSRDNNNQTSHVIKEEITKSVQLCKSNVKSFDNCEKKNEPSSKIPASTQVRSQEVIEKFMHKRKSKRGSRKG